MHVKFLYFLSGLPSLLIVNLRIAPWLVKDSTTNKQPNPEEEWIRKGDISIWYYTIRPLANIYSPIGQKIEFIIGSSSTALTFAQDVTSHCSDVVIFLLFTKRCIYCHIKLSFWRAMLSGRLCNHLSQSEVRSRKVTYSCWETGRLVAGLSQVKTGMSDFDGRVLWNVSGRVI